MISTVYHNSELWFASNQKQLTKSGSHIQPQMHCLQVRTAANNVFYLKYG